MAEELYTGPKFETVFLSWEAPSHQHLQRLIHWCTVFHRENLAPAHETGTAGNLSFRLEEGSNAFCITAAGLIAKCKLSPDDFVVVEKCDIQNKQVFVRGNRKPSSESMMHFAIYKALPKINAVFHGHHEQLLRNAQLLDIPVTETSCDYGSEELVESIRPLLGKHNFFIIREHGFLSTGTNMEQAGALSLHYKQKNESLM
jgi:ribulose-5-phosphate 4-epimerase/fuculose-1-phosphate aldolase